MKGSLKLLTEAAERYLILDALKQIAREQFDAGITKSPNVVILTDENTGEETMYEMNV